MHFIAPGPIYEGACLGSNKDRAPGNILLIDNFSFFSIVRMILRSLIQIQINWYGFLC